MDLRPSEIFFEVGSFNLFLLTFGDVNALLVEKLDQNLIGAVGMQPDMDAAGYP